MTLASGHLQGYTSECSLWSLHNREPCEEGSVSVSGSFYYTREHNDKGSAFRLFFSERRDSLR